MVAMMRRVLVSSPGVVEVETVPTPAPGPGEVLVRMTVSGICGSDVHAAHGRHPFVPLPYHPGHEVVGVVAGVGTGVTLDVGERVVVEPILFCGSCKYCRDGRYNLCRTMAFFGCTAPGGGMADFFVLPEHRLHLLPAALTDLQGALVEPLSTPVHAVRLAGPDLTGQTVAILGAGTIGLLTLAAARQRGAAQIAATDPLASKRELALRLGADSVHDATAPDLIEAVRAELGESADVVFDCVAVQRTVDQAVAMAVKGGTVVIVGVPAAPVTVALPEIQDLQIRIQGSATYVRQDYLESMRLLAAGLVEPDDLITAQYPLTQAPAAFAAAATGRQVKVVLLAEPEALDGAEQQEGTS